MWYLPNNNLFASSFWRLPVVKTNMNCYAIRITYEQLTHMSYTKSVDFILEQKPKKYFLVTELGGITGKAHLQGYLDLGDVKINTFRKKLSEYVKKNKKDKDEDNKAVKAGNGLYSCKKTDVELPINYLSYLCKEDKHPIHNFTEEELELVRIRQEAYVLERRRKKQERQPLWKQFITDNEEWLGNLTPLQLESDITARYLDWYLSEDTRQENEFQTIRNIRTVLLKYSPKFKREYYENIRDKVLMCSSK